MNLVFAVQCRVVNYKILKMCRQSVNWSVNSSDFYELNLQNIIVSVVTMRHNVRISK